MLCPPHIVVLFTSLSSQLLGYMGDLLFLLRMNDAENQDTEKHFQVITSWHLIWGKLNLEGMVD